MIAIKRVYEPKSTDDGYRVLADRLWPRGLTKAEAAVDLWMKEIAPSDELRKWFGHDPAKWNGFQHKYTKELKANKQLIAELKQLEQKHKKITILYGSRDETHNQAVVIAELVKNVR